MHVTLITKYSKTSTQWEAIKQLLDGLPLVDPKNDKKFFPGDPVISSFNHAVYIGFVMPFELKAKLTPGKDN